MKATEDAGPDVDLAKRVAKLWPHREHESSSVLGLLCRAGVHRWRRLDTAALVPGRDVEYCFWCSKVKIDGVIYDT